MDPREQLIRSMLGKTVHVIVDRPMGYLHGNILYPINYGYIPGVIAGDGEEQDAYILGVDVPLTSFDGRVIGVVRRKNDCEDKLVVAPEGMSFPPSRIAEAVYFQERYFDHTIEALSPCPRLLFHDSDRFMQDPPFSLFSKRSIIMVNISNEGG